MSAEVEIEFAVVLGDGKLDPHQFGFLQIRPLAAGYEAPEIPSEVFESDAAVVATDLALGNGINNGLRDVIYVPSASFDRSLTLEIAEEIGKFNREMVRAATPYLLLGPGRWGSSDRWLGIPVRWDQISGARVIVETDLEDFRVSPSQGTHFFQNLTSFQVGYLTVNSGTGKGRLDWDWFDTLPVVGEGRFVRHVRVPEPLTILIDGRTRQGVVMRPGNPADGEGPRNGPTDRGT